MSLRTLIPCCALLVLAGCSGGDSSTSPTPVTGGPSLDFSFPATGASHSATFPDAGSYGYHCIPHQGSGMTGTVVVNASGADSVLVQVGAGNALSFSPATATIKPGGTVRWVNASSMTNHTVTRP